MTDQKSQEQIDREQIEAGCKLSQIMIEQAKNKNFTVDEREAFELKLKNLMIPQRFKDLSASELKKMIVNKYVEEASLQMMRNYEKRKIDVGIDLKDQDLVQDLCSYWEHKGFKVEICYFTD